MHIRQIVFLSALPAWIVSSAGAGEFQNLNFEQATIPPTPAGQFGPLFADPALAFPGWIMGPNGSANPNYTLYNNLTLGSVAQVLVGPDYPNAIGYTPLQGSYSALLQFGPSTTLGTPALIQTGLVPADARSITFLVSQTHNDARVTLDGTVIPLVPIGGGRMAGDVTTFAGREAQLMFSTTSYNGPWLYFDDVTFSPVAVPEPSLLWLVGLSFIVLYFCRRLPVKTKSDRLAMKPARAGCTLLCILGFPLAASAATIDFESLPGMPNAIVPVPAASQLSDQFLSTLGVSFSSGSPYVAVVNLGQFHAASGINSIGGSTPGGLLTYDGAFPIVATFFDPNHPATPATTDFVSLRIDLVPTSGQNVTLNAFDLNGHLITSFVTPDDSGATLHVSAAGIHSVQFIGTMDSTGAAVDDFTFNPVVAVPEPSTISLLLVGGAALWYAVQRRARYAA